MKQNIALILISVVFVAIIGVGGYFIYKQNETIQALQASINELKPKEKAVVNAAVNTEGEKEGRRGRKR